MRTKTRKGPRTVKDPHDGHDVHDRQSLEGGDRTSSTGSRPRRTLQSALHESCSAPRVISWDEWVSEERAADHLHASVATLRRMRALGKLPFTTMAGHIYYHPDDLARLLANSYGRTG
jgi:hypothetical protein